MIVKATTYGKPSDPFLRVVEEAEILPSGRIRTTMTAHGRDGQPVYVMLEPRNIPAKA